MTKELLAKTINKNCVRSSCFVCAEADKYKEYTECPHLPLKQIAVQRPLTADDIPDELVE